jgi:spermidine dehydrogenase
MRIDGPPNQRDVHRTRGGPGIHPPGKPLEGEDDYDCVIVGAGASGLAAAKFYRDRFGPDARILILDPLPDFGGHAQRNEFHVPNAAAGGADLMLLRNGGTFNLDSVGTWNQPAGGRLDIPGSYGQPALDLLDWAGVDPHNFPSTSAPGIPSSYGLRPMLLFPKRDWGKDTLIPNRTSGQAWPDFLATTPFSAAARAGIAKIQTDTTTDYLAAKHGPLSDQQKKAILARITHKRYMTDYVGVPEEATLWYQRNGHSLLGAGVQAISAGDAWALGQPGFDGLALTDDIFPGIGRSPQMGLMPDGEPSPLWPDGNSSLLRLVVSKLVPGSFPGAVDQETIVKSRCDYSKLDRPGNTVRIRLNSVVYRVEPGDGRHRRGFWKHGHKPHESRHGLATVDYLVDGERRGRRVRAAHVVMACWNRVTAHLVDGLPRDQVENLCYARKVPLIYARAALKNWQAFADAKIASVTPRGNSLFWDSTSLSAGARFGNAYGPTPNEPPSAPAMLNFQVVATDHRATPQLAAYEGGRKRLLEMSFGDLEGALYDVLDRSVNKSGGDFDPERDIHSIMVNRWNYGYAHELTSVWDPSLFGPNAKQPHVRGRAPFRNVAIANSDSGAFAYTHSAISEAFRAIGDLPG